MNTLKPQRLIHFSKIPLNSPFFVPATNFPDDFGTGKKNLPKPPHQKTSDLPVFTSMVFSSEGHNHHTLTSLTWKFPRLTQGERGMVGGLDSSSPAPAPWKKIQTPNVSFRCFFKSDFKNSFLFVSNNFIWTFFDVKIAVWRIGRLEMLLNRWWGSYLNHSGSQCRTIWNYLPAA